MVFVDDRPNEHPILADFQNAPNNLLPLSRTSNFNMLTTRKAGKPRTCAAFFTGDIMQCWRFEITCTILGGREWTRGKHVATRRTYLVEAKVRQFRVDEGGAQCCDFVSIQKNPLPSENRQYWLHEGQMEEEATQISTHDNVLINSNKDI